MGSGLYDDLIKILKKNGCYKLREAKGSHEWWCSPINNHRFPVSKTINKKGTFQDILKQAGIK